MVNELAGEYAGKLKIGKLNVDDNPRTPARFGVRDIPILLLFKDGHVQQQIVGAMPKTHLVKALATVVSSERECVRINPVADGDLERQEGIRDGERRPHGD
jgi:thioredoxin-like negative regulator of GroEL